MRKYLKKLTHRIFNCPGCQKKLRIPVRAGKTLRVTCPHCHSEVDVAFETRLFSWDSTLSFKDNIAKTIERYRSLPLPTRAMIFFFSFLLVFFLYSLVVFFEDQNRQKTSVDQSPHVRYEI